MRNEFFTFRVMQAGTYSFSDQSACPRDIVRQGQSCHRSVSMCSMPNRDVQSLPRKHISGRMRRLLSRDLQPFHRSVINLSMRFVWGRHLQSIRSIDMHSVFTRYLQSFPQSASMRPMFSRDV